MASQMLRLGRARPENAAENENDREPDQLNMHLG
jgi:hypothetical protein